MKVMLVWPVAEFSIWDVAQGYRHALGRLLGEANVKDYFLNKRSEYHRRAMPAAAATETNVAKFASESVLTEAMYFGADVVIVVSGLSFHPIGFWLLEKAGIPAAAILTESPYDDLPQAQWAHTGIEHLIVFTNELRSAERYRWNYLPPAYDVDVHRPVPPNAEDVCDVLMIGTGWADRQAILEGVNWDGIDLRLYGVWPELKEDSPIHKFMQPLMVKNSHTPWMYNGARICLNFHRKAEGAYSINPRAYEIAACGGFQLSDPRPECWQVFGDSVPTFTTSGELENLIRHYLANESERRELAAKSLAAVSRHSFDQRAESMIDTISKTLHQRGREL